MGPDSVEPMTFTFTELPRGGTLVESAEFRLQIGSYPETIKDTMALERGVPNLYLLPDDLFDTDSGVSSSDLEFPVYFNYFIKGQPFRFICHRHQVRPIVRVLREAVSGPFQLFLEEEYPEGKDAAAFPELRKEMHFYKDDPKLSGGRLRLKHMIRIHLFDSQGRAEVDGVEIISLGENRYRFAALGSEESQECEFRPFQEERDTSDRHGSVGFYQPPTFGVTIIGSGHGFDASSKTSGFIIWVDGKGILVDPPVNSTLWLHEHQINTRQIEDLILTHCHADHDSGTLQKILEEGRIRVHTSKTVMHSFVAKYSALTEIKPPDFRTLFEFRPVRIGARSTIAGAHFVFRYTLHPIPTLGFEVEFQGKSFYYSCDTLYDPDIIADLHRSGILPEGRMKDLLDVPWHSSLILHEAGIPPIHTPTSVLAALPEEVKKRLYLVHVSESAIPDESGLEIARPGPEHTLSIEVSRPEKSLASKILDVVCHIDLFAEMKLRKALECLSITHYLVCEPGEVFIRRDTFGDKFYMILSGEVEVLHESLPQRLFFGRYDYIGETALILNQPRNADIVARTRTELLYIEREDFLRFVEDSDLPNIFRRLDQNRAVGARWTFEKHRILAALSPLQKNQLMCAMVHTTIEKGTDLYRPGDPVESYYLVDSGVVRVSCGQDEALLGPGALVGEFAARYECKSHGLGARAESELQVYRIAGSDMRGFLESNPGTFVRLAKHFKETFKSRARLRRIVRKQK